MSQGYTYLHIPMNAAFCMTCSLLMLVEDARGNHMEEAYSRLETTQPTSGGAVTADSSCCANYVEPPGPRMPAMRTRWMAGAAAHKSG